MPDLIAKATPAELRSQLDAVLVDFRLAFTNAVPQSQKNIMLAILSRLVNNCTYAWYS